MSTWQELIMTNQKDWNTKIQHMNWLASSTACLREGVKIMKMYKIVCSKGVLKGAFTEAMAELKAKKIFKRYPDVRKIYLYDEKAKQIYKEIYRK